MTTHVSAWWRASHGLTRRLTAFSYRELRDVTVAWETRDGGRQATLYRWA